jgi:hypothetical protein
MNEPKAPPQNRRPNRRGDKLQARQSQERFIIIGERLERPSTPHLIRAVKIWMKAQEEKNKKK